MQTPIPENMNLAHETSIEEALLKSYPQQCSYGVPVPAVELKSAAIKLANHMYTSFKASGFGTFGKS